MDPAARHHACVEFHAKLSRDTGVNLAAAACEELLGATIHVEGELVTLESNPGLFYAVLGEAIADQTFSGILNHLQVAAWCYREAAEVHEHPVGMRKLFGRLYNGDGVTGDRAQAVVWLEKAADLGDAASEAIFGAFLVYGDPRAGVATDAVRGFALLRGAVEQGFGQALFDLARCYLFGQGVEKDAAQGVSLLRQAINQGDATKAMAETALAMCYMQGDGVEADTVQAALWCQRAADSGDAGAILLLPMIRTCTFCSSRPARKHCERCRKVRYCDTTCQAAHWNRDTDPHKGHCRRVAEASQGGEVGGASASAQ
jgi:TPR repeat protein